MGYRHINGTIQKIKFYNKIFFAIIVSGHSGSDAIVKQSMSDFCMNKIFQFPPNFALTEIANDAKVIHRVYYIGEKAKAFASK